MPNGALNKNHDCNMMTKYLVLPVSINLAGPCDIHLFHLTIIRIAYLLLVNFRTMAPSRDVRKLICLRTLTSYHYFLVDSVCMDNHS